MSEAPLRAELFGVEQLARHARTLATDHPFVIQHRANRLLDRLTANELSLRDFNRATLAVNPARRVPPAAEWLLDNFYLIEEQIQMARRHLTRDYSRELPHVQTGVAVPEFRARLSEDGFETVRHLPGGLMRGRPKFPRRRIAQIDKRAPAHDPNLVPAGFFDALLEMTGQG
ncbi:MAG: hypothetical protein ABIQ12_06305 [Opitutaceae bacterium]